MQFTAHIQTILSFHHRWLNGGQTCLCKHLLWCSIFNWVILIHAFKGLPPSVIWWGIGQQSLHLNRDKSLKPTWSPTTDFLKGKNSTSASTLTPLFLFLSISATHCPKYSTCPQRDHPSNLKWVSLRNNTWGFNNQIEVIPDISRCESNLLTSGISEMGGRAKGSAMKLGLGW